MPCSTISTALHFGEPPDAVGEDRLHVVGLGGEAERFGGIVIGEPETARLIDPAGFHDLRKLHDRLMDVHARNPWSYSNPQV
jgi:hypothetical protein